MDLTTKKNVSIDITEVKESISRWANFIKEKEASKITKLLYPNNNSGIRIHKDDYDNILKKPKEASSIYLYIGLSDEEKLVFYFINSFSANLKTAPHQILQCKFENIDTPINAPSVNLFSQIPPSEAQSRRLDWQKNHETWGKQMKNDGNNIVRIFTIPKNDFNDVYSHLTSDNYIFLYFALTEDFRPNKSIKKIELIVSNYGFNLPEKEVVHFCYDITTPFPPF